MKITIELNSLEELNEVTMRLLPLMHVNDDPPTFEGSDREPPVIDRDKTDLYDGVEPELTRAQKAAATRAANKKVKAAEAAAAQAAAQMEDAVKPVEGVLMPANEPEPESNVVPMTTVEGDADAEALVQAASEQSAEVDMDALRDRFHALVQNDWDSAAKILDDLGVDNFTEAMGAGFAPVVAQKLGEVAVA